MSSAKKTKLVKANDKENVIVCEKQMWVSLENGPNGLDPVME